ncbi:MAG: FtsX-like permease family protein [Anaerolineae bacterium]|nr:FtsX-like permease family protein [Anaerolineae bacterium]
MTRLFFYLRYAANNLRRGGQWTIFALFCVAAGVATVVALRGLGLSITDSLLGNLRQYNHGDINISQLRGLGPFAIGLQGGQEERLVFRPDQVQFAGDWAEQNGGQMTAYILVSNVQIAAQESSIIGRPSFASSLFIDPPSFAAMNDVRARDPAGVRVDELLIGPQDVVISANMAETLGVQVGDALQVSGSEQDFTLRGIVATETEANIENIFAAFFGFAYFRIDSAELLGLNSSPNTISVNLPDGSSSAQITAAGEFLFSRIGGRELHTTPFLYERNQELADIVARFIVAMGLGALLIGGVGIMNTMLVLVGRRTMEIASLKTFGLKGRQIAAMFLAEAILLGLLGSLIGIAVGLLLTGVVNQFGEAFLQQRLAWRIYPEAVLYGFVLGMVVTMVFGVLPVLTATKIRPGIILRPNETHLARAGFLQTLLALTLIVLVLGVIVGNILGPALYAGVPARLQDRVPNPYLLGIIGVAGTLLFLGVLALLLWLTVGLIGRLPAFGSVDLRLALRNLSSRKLRAATTLLALTAGMFALSSITLFGMGAREIVQLQFSQTLGGNVMLFPLVPRGIGQALLNPLIARLPGIQYRTLMDASAGRMVSINGAQPRIGEQELEFVPLSILSRDTNNPTLNSGPVLAGRDLTPEDRGQPVIVLAEAALLETAVRSIRTVRNTEEPLTYTLSDLGIGIGSTITVRNNGQLLNLTVIGIVGSANALTPNIAGAYLPPDVPGFESDFQINVLQVEPEQTTAFLRGMQQNPLVLALDVTFIDSLLGRIIAQLSAIPLIVGLLSLLAAAVIMANTVSLAVLERRQQIGVLKAIGLKRGRVLRVLLLENTLVGLLGGLLGIGVSALGVSLMTTIGAGLTIPIPTEARWITLGLLIAAVAIAWIATLLSARAATNERVARVLRYE